MYRQVTHPPTQVIHSQGETIKRLRAENASIGGSAETVRIILCKTFQFQRLGETVTVVWFCATVSSVTPPSNSVTPPSRTWPRSTWGSTRREWKIWLSWKLTVNEIRITKVWSNVFNWTTGSFQKEEDVFQSNFVPFQVNHKTEGRQVQKNQQVQIQINGWVARTVTNV